MAGRNNYISNPKNSFFALEDDDVDDDTFLRGARTNNYSNYSGSGYNTSPSNNVDRERDLLEERRQQLIERRKEIEERTIESSQRSLGLLRESEQIGVETAEELLHQREQLERTEKRLDEINSTLRFSQKHIQGIKSVFGSLKNLLSGKAGEPVASPSKGSDPPGEPSVDFHSPLTDTLSQSRARSGLVSPSSDQPGQLGPRSQRPYDRTLFDKAEAAPVNDTSRILDRNLDEMCNNLSRLKGLASGMGEEIETQNELLEGIMVKTDKADMALIRQNKDMKSLLKK